MFLTCHYLFIQNKTLKMEIDNKLEYKLKYYLNSMTLKHLETRDVLDKEKSKEFNNTFKTDKKVQAFCMKLENSTYFPVFNVPLSDKETIHTVFLCEIALGETIYVNNEYVKNNLPLPEGFDTFVTDIKEEQNYLHNKSIDLSNFYYVVNDTSRILPMYEVTFQYDEEFEKNARNKNICHKCLNEEAVMYCPSERASFCQTCDDAVHFDAFLKRHERKYFDKCGQKKFINCKDHTTKTVEFYCTDCSLPICSYCKVSGSHASPEFANHNIISFVKACDTLSECIKDSSTILQNQSTQIEIEKKNFIEQAEASKNNIAGIYEKIQTEMKNLKLQLEHIEETKKQKYNAGYIEIVKQVENSKRMLTFPSELDPTDKLQYYSMILEDVSHTKVESVSGCAVEIELQGSYYLK